MVSRKRLLGRGIANRWDGLLRRHRVESQKKTAPGEPGWCVNTTPEPRTRGLTPHHLQDGGAVMQPTQNQEYWRTVPGYGGNYEASNLGRIRSVDRMERFGNSLRWRSGTILRPANIKGYEHVKLYGPDRRGTRTVHTVIAEAFHGPRPGLNYDCCHNNGISDDNRAENLRWDTKQENRLDIIRHGHSPLSIAKRSHCKYDHEFIEGGFRTDKRGWRICLACEAARKLIEREAQSLRITYAEAVKVLPMTEALSRLASAPLMRGEAR